MKPYRTRIADVPLAEGLRADEGWVDMQVQFLVDASSAGTDELVVGRTVLPPGARHERHRHPNCEEALYVLAGEIEHHIEGTPNVRMKAGDAILVPRDRVHQARCVGTIPARLLVSFSSPERETALVEQ